MSIKNWPQGERPREKIMHQGAEKLSDAELLAIFIRTGVPGFSALDIARELLNKFGDLRQCLDADLKALLEIPGLGQSKCTQLKAILELSKRYLYCKAQRGQLLKGSEDTRWFLTSQLRSHNQEVFACVFLDKQHRLISFEKIFYGTIDNAEVYPREVVRRAILCNAAAVILAHNHPSGVAEPSEADKKVTELLRDAFDLVNIALLDHIIVGDAEVMSFAEWGLI